MGLGFSHNYLLQVRGRKSGKIYSTPIDLLELGGKRFLVAPRGRTQWVRNAEAAGEVTLKRGSKRQRYRLRALSDQEKPEILKAYLDQFRREVQRYFPVPAGSPVEAFRELVAELSRVRIDFNVKGAPPSSFRSLERQGRRMSRTDLNPCSSAESVAGSSCRAALDLDGSETRPYMFLA